MKLVQRMLLIAPVVCSCVVCDQATKTLARHSLAHSGPITLINDVFRLQYTENPGAFLSLGAASPEHMRFWLFTLMTGIVLAGMLGFVLVSANSSKARIVALSLVLGGGMGNVIDRIFNEGRVIDFMNIGIGPVRTGIFNVADVAISFGIVWLCIISLFTHLDNRQEQS